MCCCQMRNLMWFVIYGYFLAVVSVTLYLPRREEPERHAGGNLRDCACDYGFSGDWSVLRNPMLKRLEEHETNMASILEACVHMLSVGGVQPWHCWVAIPVDGAACAFSWVRPLLTPSGEQRELRLGGASF